MTTIVVCSDDLVAGDLSVPDARVAIVDELCLRPHLAADVVRDDEDHLVLALHRDRVNLGVVQAAVRRLGFEPLSVGLVDLRAVGASDDLPATLAAAMARSSAFPGAEPEQIKLLPPDRSTRRALLSIGKPRYVGAPLIDPSTCRAGNGCRSCVSPCPVDALTWAGGAIAFNKNACVACGICVTACPAGAVENPSVTQAAVEAELRAAIERSKVPIGVRFRCRGSTVPAEPGWYQLEVPYTGLRVRTNRPRRALSNLAIGTSHRVAIGREFGVAFDVPLESGNGDPSRLSGLLEPCSSSIVVDLLPTRDHNQVMDLRVADIGTVTIEPSVCTTCQMCARVCPTDALMSSETDQRVEISFDPRSCTACGACVEICPEATRDAIVMSHGFDLADRAAGRRIIRKDRTSTCEVCGRPVAPTAMLERIETMLGDDAEATMAAISRRCLDCRGR